MSAIFSFDGAATPTLAAGPLAVAEVPVIAASSQTASGGYWAMWIDYDDDGITSYWSGVDPRSFLPGTNRATDRFVRASFYIDAVTQSDDRRTAAAAVCSASSEMSPCPMASAWPMRRTCPPRAGASWPTTKDLVFYGESAISPNVFWVEMSSLDFSEGAETMVLELGVDMDRILAGEVSNQFTPADPFAFKSAE